MKIGIDLGTTNSALAYIDEREAEDRDFPPVHIFETPQLVAPARAEPRRTLPSFLFLEEGILDPSGDDVLFVTGSDHGMETISEAIDVTGLLIAGGLKASRDSTDVVVAPQGTSATIFFSEAARGRAPAVAEFLRRENWAGRVVVGEELATVGLPTDTALQVAAAMATDARVNPHGVAGYGAIVANPDDPESKIGFGQHGGLGVNEQNPFLIAAGGGFVPRSEARPTSLIDIAPTVLRHLRMDHDDTDGKALPLST